MHIIILTTNIIISYNSCGYLFKKKFLVRTTVVLISKNIYLNKYAQLL